MHACDPRALTSRIGLAAFALTVAGCGSTASRELVLRIDTDAIVPVSFGSEVRSEAPLADRIEFAIFPTASTEPCAGCVRTFPVTSDQFRNRAISIGIPLEDGGGRVRVRLFRSGQTGVPRPRSTVEAVFSLPETRERANLFAFLSMGTVGVPRGTLDEPLTPETDTGAASRVGTFGKDHEGIACVDPAPPGTACVPGGFFWADDIIDLTREQLVFIHGKYVDTTEWSAERFAHAGGSTSEPEDSLGRRCPTVADGNVPAACVTPVEAARICETVGGRLPTFHEFSRLLGGLRGTRFPWGDEAPSCTDAVVGRMKIMGHYRSCSDPKGGGLPVGPVPVDVPSGRDIVELPSGTLLHVEGNVGEWVSATNLGSCSPQDVIVEDPRCATYWGFMGGSYDASPRSSSSIEELVTAPEATQSSSPFTGFRCVYDARE